LSKGKVLNRLYELRDTLRAFLGEESPQLADDFSDNEWVATPAYLADITVMHCF